MIEYFITASKSNLVIAVGLIRKVIPHSHDGFNEVRLELLQRVLQVT
jgi:hypothetical protein